MFGAVQKLTPHLSISLKALQRGNAACKQGSERPECGISLPDHEAVQPAVFSSFVGGSTRVVLYGF